MFCKAPARGFRSRTVTKFLPVTGYWFYMIIAPRFIAPPFTPVEDRTLFAQRRAAIDEIATTRAKVIRCGLFGTYLFRPNPLKPDTDDMKKSWVTEMSIQLDGIARTYALACGRDPKDYFPAKVCMWIAKCSADRSDDVAALHDMMVLTKKLIDAAPKGGVAFEKLLIEHAVFGRTTFFPAISTLCEAFWSDLDQQRHKEVGLANETSAAIGVTLQRLEHIGRHVRLVSLNASVEAARVGDAGRGLGVIAQEFKCLAEEIQELAHSAHKNTDGMKKSSA